ncbi:carbon storage regulator CsrA [Bacillus carboniphilus]|uniref:Translational regulator CsrA n=1 Tax=Bacillus carboniphilus TaxID=86663 RepID=A0ABY9JZW4_9BACI|nr:carbon storage regulator CsrA [Bacillus carboniphilus]WLR44318.1 carbon storage regulator CsrA [Bacillus carboniphilus]
MLILGRKRNQSIIINEMIEVTVVSIEGDQVKLGIKAPKSIDVHRKEVYEEILTENNEASIEASEQLLKQLSQSLNKD